MRLAFFLGFAGFVNKSGISRVNLRQILADAKFASRKTLRKTGKNWPKSLSTLSVDKASSVAKINAIFSFDDSQFKKKGRRATNRKSAFEWRQEDANRTLSVGFAGLACGERRAASADRREMTCGRADWLQGNCQAFTKVQSIPAKSTPGVSCARTVLASFKISRSSRRTM